jgi:hypothetical protein
MKLTQSQKKGADVAEVSALAVVIPAKLLRDRYMAVFPYYGRIQTV